MKSFINPPENGNYKAPSVGQGFSLANDSPGKAKSPVGQGFSFANNSSSKNISRPEGLPYKNAHDTAASQNRYKKRIRLKCFNYRGTYRYFITICTNARHAIFTNSAIVHQMLEILAESARNSDFQVHAYCFMPNHLHLLVEGNNDEADLRRFIKLYKQKTGYIYKRNNENSLWQVNYYEHILRKEEATGIIARYIWDNPVRKKIVGKHDEYPYSGSLSPLGKSAFRECVKNSRPEGLPYRTNPVGQDFSLANDPPGKAKSRSKGLPYKKAKSPVGQGFSLANDSPGKAKSPVGQGFSFAKED